MKGLLIKDSYLVFKQSKLLVIIAFVLMIINAVAVFFGEENMIGIFIIQNFAASLGLASITNDETYKWNIYSTDAFLGIIPKIRQMTFSEAIARNKEKQRHMEHIY